MAQLAIRGHDTRGKEVIEIIEMLGGKNKIYPNGLKWFTGINTDFYYTIEEDNHIHVRLGSRKGDYIKFTLEQFLEKFPYKIGDKVQHKGATSCGSIFEVEEMRWEEDTVKYTLCLFGCNYKRSTLTAEYLQPYKEETMEGKYNVEKYLKVFDESEHGLEVYVAQGYELKEVNGSFYIVKQTPSYPKTYKECAKELGYNQVMPTDHILGYRGTLLSLFQQLIICRDAYWKIAGDWNPNRTRADERKYCIVNTEGNITKWVQKTTNKIIAFPTAEMRDAFYENFKELINETKELL